MDYYSEGQILEIEFIRSLESMLNTFDSVSDVTNGFEPVDLIRARQQTNLLIPAIDDAYPIVVGEIRNQLGLKADHRK
jgi:hypothetical protein